MKSKKLIRTIVQPYLDASGKQQNEFANEMGLKSNYVSMLLGNNDKALISLNRLEQLKYVCNLNDEQVLEIARQRIEDANGAPIKISVETFGFLCDTSRRVDVRAYVARKLAKRRVFAKKD
jgi:hypothetical protein